MRFCHSERVIEVPTVAYSSALCAALVEARKGAKLSQQELARRLRRSQSFIAKIEVGERRLDVLEFIEIARALNRDPAELLSHVLG